MPGGRDARRPDHVDTDVTLVGQLRRPGVEADADTHLQLVRPLVLLELPL